jgi:hypothetical protein
MDTTTLNVLAGGRYERKFEVVDLLTSSFHIPSPVF